MYIEGMRVASTFACVPFAFAWYGGEEWEPVDWSSCRNEAWAICFHIPQVDRWVWYADGDGTWTGYADTLEEAQEAAHLCWLGGPNK